MVYVLTQPGGESALLHDHSSHSSIETGMYIQCRWIRFASQNTETVIQTFRQRLN